MNPLTQMETETEKSAQTKTRWKWKNTKRRKQKHENTKRNERVSEPLRSLDCRGCTATLSCATEALKPVAKCLSAVPTFPPRLSVGLRNVCRIRHGPPVTCSLQPWNIGWVIKISNSVSSLSAVAVDLVSAPASQTYNEHIISISSDVTSSKRNHTQASLECRVFEVKLDVSNMNCCDSKLAD